MRPSSPSLAFGSIFISITSVSGAAAAQEVIWSVRESSLRANDFGDEFVLADDLDGDGIRDVIVASPDPRVNSLGNGKLVGLSGVDGAELFLLLDPTGTRFGKHVRALGSDLNGDGVEEFVGEAVDPAAKTSQVLIFSGRDRALIRSITISHPKYQSSSPLEAMPDVDGDGARDIGVGHSDSFEIYSSATGARVFKFVPPGTGGTVFFGGYAQELADVNFDGVADLLLADRGYGGAAQGAFFVFSLKDGSKLHEVHGNVPSDYLGSGIAALGDLDGDGAGDFAVGSEEFGGWFPGVVTIYSGASCTPLDFVVPPDGVNIHALWLSGRAGDFDGDGWQDFTIGEGAFIAAPDNHVTWVVSGRTGARLVNASTVRSGTHSKSSDCIDFDGDGFGELLLWRDYTVMLLRGGSGFLSAEQGVVELPGSDDRTRRGPGTPPSPGLGSPLRHTAFLQASGFAPGSVVTLMLRAIDGLPVAETLDVVITDQDGGWWGPFPLIPAAPHLYELEAWGVDPHGRLLVTPRTQLEFVLP